MNINMASMIGGYTADRFELNMGHVNLWLYVHIIILDVCRVYVPVLHNYVQVYMLLCVIMYNCTWNTCICAWILGIKLIKTNIKKIFKRKQSICQ